MENIYGFEEPVQKPQLHNTRYLKAGIVLSSVAVAFSLFLIAYYILDSFSEDGGSHIGYNIISVISTFLFVSILLTLLSYVGNFNMQSLKMLGILVIILFFISMMMDIGYSVWQRHMLESGTMSFSQWGAITGVLYMVFNLIFWAVGIAFSAVMISNKTDFVGGIRSLGTVYLTMILVNIAIYIIRLFALPYLSFLYDSAIDNMRLANALLSSVTLAFRVILFCTFIYVFSKARQYKAING